MLRLVRDDALLLAGVVPRDQRDRPTAPWPAGPATVEQLVRQAA